MTVSAPVLNIINIVIWILCILLGMGVGAFVCSWIGRLLGWMIAGSLDASILRGGRVGSQIGKLSGILLGIALGIFGAFQSVAFVATLLAH